MYSNSCFLGLLFCMVAQVSCCIASSPLPGAIYDNAFCKKLIPALVIRKNEVNNCHKLRVKRSAEEKSSYVINLLKNNDNLSHFESSDISKIPYKNDKELKLKREDPSSNNSPYKKKVVEKQGRDNDRKDNPPKSIQELIKSITHGNKEKTEILTDEVSKNKNNVIKEDDEVIEIEIENPCKKKNKKSVKADTTLEEIEKGTEKIDDKNIKKSKNCKRNAPRPKTIRIKMVQKPLHSRDKRQNKDPVIKIIVKHANKNKVYKFKCKSNKNCRLRDGIHHNYNTYDRDNTDDCDCCDTEDECQSVKYNDNGDCCFYTDDFDDCDDCYDNDYYYYDDDNDEDDDMNEKNYDNDNSRNSKIKERLKKFGNLKNIFRNLKDIAGFGNDDNKGKKIKIKLNLVKNKDNKSGKSNEVVRDKYRNSNSRNENRFLREIDKDELNNDDSNSDKITDSKKDKAGANNEMVINITDKETETDDLLKLFDLLGVTELESETGEDEKDIKSVKTELNLANDLIKDHEEEIFTTPKMINQKDNNDHFITNNQKTETSQVNNSETSDTYGLPPEVIKMLAENYFKDLRMVNPKENLKDSQNNNYTESSINQIDANKTAPNSNDDNLHSKRSSFDHNLLFNNINDNSKIVSNEKSKLDQNNLENLEKSIAFDSNQFFLQNNFMKQNTIKNEEFKLPANFIDDKITQKDVEEITKYIYQTTGVSDSEINQILPEKIKLIPEEETIINSKINQNAAFSELNQQNTKSFADEKNIVSSFGITSDVEVNKSNAEGLDFDVTSIINDLIKMEEIKNRENIFGKNEMKNNLLNMEEIMQIKNVPCPVAKTGDSIEKTGIPSDNTKYNKVIVEKKLFHPTLNNFKSDGTLSGSLFTKSLASDPSNSNNFERKLKRSSLY